VEQLTNMKFIFIDTFAMAKIAADKELFKRVRDYLFSNELTLVINIYLLIEIYQHEIAWDEILEFISSVPFVIAKNIDKVQDEEVSSYPNKITLPYSLCSDEISERIEIIKAAFIYNFIEKISLYAKSSKEQAKEILANHVRERQNVPPDENGKYSDFQFWLFIESNILSFLLQKYPDFIKEKKVKKEKIIESAFSSYNISTAAVFYEYYLQNKKPKLSDIGDYWHLSYLPYLQFAVLDKERFALINRFRSDDRVKKLAQKHQISISLECRVFNWEKFLYEVGFLSVTDSSNSNQSNRGH
jgi:hypothetical protein